MYVPLGWRSVKHLQGEEYLFLLREEPFILYPTTKEEVETYTTREPCPLVIFCQGDGTYLDKKESCDRENHSITGAGLSLAKG